MLDISYKKEIVVPFDPIDDGFLDQVGVLVFIKEDVFEFILQGFSDFLVFQNLEGHMLQIAKVCQGIVLF